MAALFVVLVLETNVLKLNKCKLKLKIGLLEVLHIHFDILKKFFG